MKIINGVIAITFLFILNAQAQSSVKINFLNNSPLFKARLQTTLNQEKPIVMKHNEWVIIQSVGDSVGFFIDDRKYVLHFEPNKQYYFVFETSHLSGVSVLEKSEREFIITAMLNGATSPREYSLKNINN